MTVNVPALSSKVAPEVRRAIEMLAKSITTGVTQDELNRAISKISPTNGTVTTVVTDSGLPYMDVPPTPSNVKARGGYHTIIITWDATVYANFGYAEVWRSGTNDLGAAVRIGTTQSTLYGDIPPESAEATAFYYWVRLVNNPLEGATEGVAGAYSEMVTATTATDVQYLLELLSAEVQTGALYQLITSKIFDEGKLTEMLLTMQLLLNDHVESIRRSDYSLEVLGTQTTNTLALIATESSTRATADSAEASQRNLLSAQVNDPNTGLAKAHARIYDESNARATAVSAVASRTTTLETTVSTHTTSITQQSESIDGIHGLYAVSINNNGVASGFGLVSDLIDGVVVSQFGVNAGTFFVTNNTGSNIIPFIISGDRTVINNANIVDLTASNIRAGAITADLLTVGYDPALGRSTIAAAIIGEGEITNALIGDTIQSTTYTGLTGWRIDKAGSCTFNNIYARGDIEATSIKADTVNAISTLMIQDNAVTVSVGADSTSATINSLGQPVQIFVSCTLHANIASTDFITGNVLLKRDGVTMKTYPVVKTGYALVDTFSVGYMDLAPSNGAHTYSFDLEITYRSSIWDTLVIESPYIGLTGLKK